jgi:hypothetical protein
VQIEKPKVKISETKQWSTKDYAQDYLKETRINPHYS